MDVSVHFLKRYETNAYQRIAKFLVIIRVSTIVVFEEHFPNQSCEK